MSWEAESTADFLMDTLDCVKESRVGSSLISQAAGSKQDLTSLWGSGSAEHS